MERSGSPSSSTISDLDPPTVLYLNIVGDPRELWVRYDDPIEELGGDPGLMELEALSLPGSASAEDLVRAFARWPHGGGLRSLDVDTHGAHLASLRTLRLRNAAVDGASVEALGRSEALRALEVLDLGNARWRDGRRRDLELPAPLAKLRHLIISAIGLSERSFAARSTTCGSWSWRVARSETPG